MQLFVSVGNSKKKKINDKTKGEGEKAAGIEEKKRLIIRNGV
jgi:hypothetical protein